MSSAMLSIVTRSMACRSLLTGRSERAREADAITLSNMRMRAAGRSVHPVAVDEPGVLPTAPNLPPDRRCHTACLCMNCVTVWFRCS